MTKCEDELTQFLVGVTDDDLGSVQDCILDGDYAKTRDILNLVREAFEAGWDARYNTLTWHDL